MPKLKDRSPKYCKMNGQAVVYCNGRPHCLGRHGSPESWTAYHRFCAGMRASPVVSSPSEEKHVTVRELTAAFLDYAKANILNRLIEINERQIAVVDAELARIESGCSGYDVQSAWERYRRQRDEFDAEWQQLQTHYDDLHENERN